MEIETSKNFPENIRRGPWGEWGRRRGCAGPQARCVQLPRGGGITVIENIEIIDAGELYCCTASLLP